MRTRQCLLVMAIVVIHMLVFLAWPKLFVKSNVAENLLRPPIQLFFVQKTPHVNRSKDAIKITAHDDQQKSFLRKQRKLEVPITPSQILPKTALAASAPPLIESAKLPILNLEIGKMSKDEKLEFETQDKFFVKSTEPNYIAFRKRISGAAITTIDGTILERKFQGDGRPVTKVTTPYGVYCIRHPKLGESPELAPYAVPVNCGNL